MTRRPGDWPEDTSVFDTEADEQGARHLAVTAVQACFHVTVGAIRADLEDQPSTRAIRAAAKRWHEAVSNVADELIAARRRGG